MASVTTPETVWVGFMDVVPVIGKLKQGVEWVLALYEGNQEVVKEKELVIENLLKRTSELVMMKGMKLTLPKTPPTGEKKGEKGAMAAGASASGLQSVTEVKIEELLEHVREVPGGRKGKKESQEKERAEEKKKVEKIKKELIEKIRLIKPNYNLEIDLSLEMRSKRGEHVLNNDILKFHSKVLKHFRDIPKYRLHLPNHLDGHTLDKDTADKIERHMVVDFEMTEFYVNANAILYGFYSKELREAYLHMLNLQSEDQNRAERVNTIIDLMNNLEIYVDQMAKAKWINNNRDKQIQFNDVKDKVVRMYKKERGVSWCEKVKEIIRKKYMEDMLEV